MATSTVGTIQYDAVINTDGLDSGASKVGGILGGIGKVAAAATVAAAAGIGVMVKQSVQAYAQYEQMVGGVETLFKSNASTVEAYAQNAYKTAGLSANQYMETVTSFSASLLQGLGGDTAKAAEIGNMAVTDMSDNANKFGTSMESIQYAYQGFAKDNFTMLDNLKLGYGGTASEMARLVNDSGVMGESFKATAENVKDVPFDKMAEAIHKVQTEMGITGTTAKEASQTISGSFNATKSAWENVLTSFGSGNNEMIKASINGLVDSAKNLVTNLTAIIPNIITGIGTLITTLAGQLPAILQALIPPFTNILILAVQTIVTALPQFINAAIQLVVALAQGLATTLPTLIPELIKGIRSMIDTLVTNLPLFINAAVQIIVALVTGLAQAAPTLIPQIITAILTMLNALLQQLPLLLRAGIQLLVAVVQGLANALPQLISYIPIIINTLITELTKPPVLKMLIYASLQIIMAVALGLIQAIPVLIGAIPQIISSLIQAFKNYLSTYASIGSDMLHGIWNGLSGAKDWLIGQIKGLMGSVTNAIKGFFGIHSPSTLFRDQIGKNLALGIGEGFSDGMDRVSQSMQDAIPTPNIDIGGIGTYGASTASQPQTIIVKVGDETLLTKIIDGINDKSMLQGYNAIKV